MMLLAFPALFAATPALAHVGTAAHVHPHGVEAAVVGLAIVVLVWLRWAR